MKILIRLINDYDQKMEAYTFILAKLKAQNCRKINAFFNKHRFYPFERWLAVVVRNCYWDWLRQTKGRKRLPKLIENLPETEKKMYQLIFWKGFTVDVCYEIMTSNGDLKISFENFLEKFAKISWMAGRDKYGNNRIILESACLRNPKTDPMIMPVVVDKNELPDEEYIDRENRRIFQDLLDKLTAQERLILKLHFLYGRTLKQICESMKINNIWKARRLLKRTINRLTREIQDKEITFPDPDQHIENIF